MNGPDLLAAFASGPGTVAAANAVLYGQVLLGGAVLWDTGTLALLGGSSTLALNGHTLTLPQALLQGVLLGPGTVSVNNAAITFPFVLSGGPVLVDVGTASLFGNAQLSIGTADSAALQVAAGATLAAPTDATVTANGTAIVDNAGLFEKTAGTGAAFIDPNFTTTGTVFVATGALVLNDANSTLGGMIEGAGDLVLRGGGNFTLEPGVSLTVATLDLAVNGDGFGSFTTLKTDLLYNGRFSVDNYSGNPAFLLLNGNKLILTGPTTLNGEVEGGGTVQQLGGAAVRTAHRTLLQRATALGHRRTDNPDLRISVDGGPVARAPPTANRVRIELPPGAREVRLVSRSWVPSELDAAANDGRRLGVPIAAVCRDGRKLALRGPAFAEGFYPMTQEESWRWTDGAALLRLRPLPRASVLLLRLLGGLFSCWDEAAGPHAETGTVA